MRPTIPQGHMITSVSLTTSESRLKDVTASLSSSSLPSRVGSVFYWQTGLASPSTL